MQILTNLSTQVNGSVGTDGIMDYPPHINNYNVDLGNIMSLLFDIKACKHAHVLLSNSYVRYSSEPLYRIIIKYDKNDYSFMSHNAESELKDYVFVRTEHT